MKYQISRWLWWFSIASHALATITIIILIIKGDAK